jgi:F-box protein 11
LTSPEVWRRLEGMAKQVRAALERAAPGKRAPARRAREKRRGRVGAGAAEVAASEALAEVAGLPRGPQAKTEAPTLVVDQAGRGDHVTITEAIEGASAGSRILVRPGVYKEGLVIEKPLEVIGDGALGTVVVEAEGKNAVLFRASMGRVANLVLRQKAGDRCFGVQIAQGRLELEGCDITSEGTACVAIHHGADPVLRRNRIHDGKSGGVFIFLNAQGTLEDNDILGNALSGVTVWSGGNPTLRRNRVNRNEAWGVRVTDTGGGVFEDNDLRDNALGPWSISGDSEAHVRRARNLE